MIRLVALFWLAMASAALALDPSETLDDPALEARAQALDAELRCVVCQSEALTSSNADWARDARAVLREMIVDGKSDQEIKDQSGGNSSYNSNNINWLYLLHWPSNTTKLSKCRW